MFSIQICGYSNDRDIESGGKSTIYYNKGSQEKPGERHLTNKCAWDARIIDTLQASSRIDVDHIKVNRFTWIYWSFLSLLSLFNQYDFLNIFKCCHSPNEKLGSIKFENIDACLFLDVYPLKFLSLLKSKLFEVEKAHVCRFKKLGLICFSPPQFPFILLSVIAIHV